MENLDHRLSDHSWFPDGTEVTVIGGRYAGDHGLVVNRAPGLRPGTVWVALAASGTGHSWLSCRSHTARRWQAGTLIPERGSSDLRDSVLK